ncbi:MAG TPA: DUF2169 domain-containing protein [Candidatus Eisenbacteria bacterium]
MDLRNRTPFAAAWLVTLDKSAAEHITVVIKGTYSIRDDGTLSLLEKQPPPRPADEFHGEPGASSIKYAAELGPMKPATDVALVGSAVASRGGARAMEVSFRVGPLAKRARAYGDRRWSGFLWWRLKSGPKPFERMPLVYERACGGSDDSPRDASRRGREARNPVGRGYAAKGSRRPWKGSALPNLEDPARAFKQPGTKLPPPAGFGFIGRDWEPRLSYAGTYDEAWTKERMPLLPLDFDERHHNAAHPDLVAEGYLSGSEPVEVRGCTRSGRLQFLLPGASPTVTLRFGAESVPMDVHLETVLVDTDAMELGLVWKGDLEIHGRLPELTAIECAGGRGAS